VITNGPAIGLLSDLEYPTNCKTILAGNPGAANGVYTIDPDGPGGNAAINAYCEMTQGGGGWTLVLQTSSTSTYNYANAIWTATSAPAGSTTNAAANQDMVSPAFYTMTAYESMLCMGNLTHCNAWQHLPGTPRNLVNRPPITATQAGAFACVGFYCGANERPASVVAATSGSSSMAWHRFGYVGADNAWGTRIRIGFSGDNESTDSQDTVIGLGIDCYGYCLTYSVTAPAHGTGSGFYLYNGWAKAPYDGALQGFLFIR
jgi:hypothetical protein